MKRILELTERRRIMTELRLPDGKEGMAFLYEGGWLKGMFPFDGLYLSIFHGTFEHCWYVELHFEGRSFATLWPDVIRRM